MSLATITLDSDTFIYDTIWLLMTHIKTKFVFFFIAMGLLKFPFYLSLSVCTKRMSTQFTRPNFLLKSNILTGHLGGHP